MIERQKQKSTIITIKKEKADPPLTRVVFEIEKIVERKLKSAKLIF